MQEPKGPQPNEPNEHNALARVAPPASDAPAASAESHAPNASSASSAAPASPYAAEHSAAHGANSVSDAHYRSRMRSERGEGQATASSAPAPAPAHSAKGKKLNTLAVVSFASSLVGWTMLPVLATVVAIITGHMARSEIRRTGEEGDTFAIIGLVLSWAQVATLVGALLFVILIFGGFAALLVWLGWSDASTMGMV